MANMLAVVAYAPAGREDLVEARKLLSGLGFTEDKDSEFWHGKVRVDDVASLATLSDLSQLIPWSWLGVLMFDDSDLAPQVQSKNGEIKVIYP
jgi:hypothetical protein